MLVTTHQYLTKHPIDRTAKRLILGTIHPHFHEKFELPFFYGNECSLWKVFQEAFPSEMINSESLTEVKQFLKNHKLAVSDTIISCRRLSPTALDEDLEIIEDNREVLLDALINSNIKEVLCTSGFGRNNAFKIFYNQILGLPISAKVRKERQAIIRLPNTSKTVLVKAMYSPSRTALRGIARSTGYRLVKQTMSVAAYRVVLYREALLTQI